MLRNKNFLLTVILPILISIIIGIVIIVLNSKSNLNTRAATIVMNEKRTMVTQTDALKKEKEELTYKSADYDKTIEDNRLLLNEINALTDELNEYTTDIEAAKETIVSLDNTINEKTAYNESLSAVSKGNDGSTKSYTNTKLNVPSDIKDGRYRADGSGTILIYTIAGTLEDKQNLSVIDSHSYTFNLISGQSIKIEGTVSLTEITN